MKCLVSTIDDRPQLKMKRIVKKSNDFKDAEEWDILQHIRMRPEERQKAASELRMRVYGESQPDVKETCRKE